jgi:DNA repair exonuclease SbcCD ATPase subunit
MNEILKNDLCKYLGQLMHEHENEFDWILKDKLAEKINAVNKLLDIDKHEKTWYEKLTKKAFRCGCIL